MHEYMIYTFAIILSVSIVSICVFVFKNKFSGKSLNKAGFYISIIGTIISVIGLFMTNTSGKDTVNNVFNNVYTNSSLDSSHSENSTEPPKSDIITSAESSLQPNESIKEALTTEQTTAEQTISTQIPSESSCPRLVDLNECKTYDQDGSIILESIASDPRGNTYNNSYIFYGEYYFLNTGGGKYGSSYITKYLGCKYSKFTATLNPYKTFDKYNKNVKSNLNIYADDKLIYTVSLQRTSENIHIELNVSNVNYLKIELLPATDLANHYNQYSVILSDAKLSTK